jgi:hypothetical protein
MFDVQMARSIVGTLVEKPLPLGDALQRWGDYATWYELVDKKYVEHAGGMAVVTPSGRVSYAG